MRRLVVAAAVLIVLGACGGDSDSGSSTKGGSDGGAKAGPGTVVIKDISFKPSKVKVKVGDTVTWRWADGSVQHDVNGGDAFKSEIQKSGTFEHKFDQAGTFQYHCTVHPAMKGTVEVS